MPASLSRRLTFADGQFGSGAPTNWYWGLSSTQPNLDGTGFTEPGAGVGYARVTHANNPTNWPAAILLDNLAMKRNATKITWPNPTGTWTPAAWWIVMLTLTGGSTAEYWGKMDDTYTPKSGSTPVELDVLQCRIPF